MTTQRRKESVTAEGYEVKAYDVKSAMLKLSRQKENECTAWWRQVLSALPRMLVRSEKQPTIGQQCLVLKGKPGYNEGQVALVTQRKQCLVEIAFLRPNWKLQTKLKRPGTLIMLEKGIKVVQDNNGVMKVQVAQVHER